MINKNLTKDELKVIAWNAHLRIMVYYGKEIMMKTIELDNKYIKTDSGLAQESYLEWERGFEETYQAVMNKKEN